MLTYKLLGSSTDEISYYANLGDAENHDTYYSEDGARPGTWYGDLAEALGLGGAVSPEVFRNLLEGKSPDGKKSLVQNQRGKNGRRAGIDFTFTPPKSFSVAWSQASDEDRKRLDDVLEQGLFKTLDVVQALCGKTRRGKGSLIVEDASIAFAVFSHDTARGTKGSAPDANRHHHCVLPNIAIREDGTSGSVDSRAIFTRRMKHALGNLYRAEVAKLLTEQLGVRTYRPEKEATDGKVGWWEIEGVPAEAIKAMSKRRQEIERWLRQKGLSGARAAEKAALVTRLGKERFTWKELNAAWTELGNELGFGREEVEALFGRAVVLSDTQKEAVATATVGKGVKGLMEHQARFTRNELLEAVATEAQGEGIGIDEVMSAVSRELTQNTEIVRLEDKQGVPSYTTKTMLRLEKSAVERAERMHARSGHAVSLAVVDEVTKKSPTLKSEQLQAVRDIATSGDVVSVTGVAGAGKTYMMTVCKEVLERRGMKLIGTSLAARAAKVLEAESGIESLHVDKLFVEIKQGRVVVDENTCLVADESGTIGTVAMAKLLAIAERAGAKVVLIGDDKQTQAVSAGAPFRKISEAIGTTTMSQVVRQKEAWARQAVLDLRDGRADEALAAIDARGQLSIEPEREDAVEKLCERWQQLAFADTRGVTDTLVLAGTTADVRELNERIQDVMHQRGQLGEYAVEVRGQRIHLGDRVMITKNNRLLGLQNGTTGEVTGAYGSRVSIKLDDGIEVEIDTEEFDRISVGYASTIHKAQGTTKRNAIFFASDAMTDRELSYVAGSRAKEKTYVFSYETAAAGIDALASLMNRSRQNEMAMEHEL